MGIDADSRGPVGVGGQRTRDVGKGEDHATVHGSVAVFMPVLYFHPDCCTAGRDFDKLNAGLMCPCIVCKKLVWGGTWVVSLWLVGAVQRRRLQGALIPVYRECKNRN